MHLPKNTSRNQVVVIQKDIEGVLEKHFSSSIEILLRLADENNEKNMWERNGL